MANGVEGGGASPVLPATNSATRVRFIPMPSGCGYGGSPLLGRFRHASILAWIFLFKGDAVPGLTGKIRACVEAEGRPVTLRLTGGQVRDGLDRAYAKGSNASRRL